MSHQFEPVTLKDLRSAVLEMIPGAKSATRQVASLAADADRVRLLGLASLLFFIYERGHNRRVQTIADATLYCSTALAAGHGEIQPSTTVGKLVGSLLLALGQSTSSAAASKTDLSGSDPRVLQTLEAILAELRDRPPAPYRELAPPTPIPPLNG